MFIEFDDVFSSNTQLQSLNPDLFLQYLNSIAPRGTNYTFTSNEIYTLQPVSGCNDYTIEGLVLEDEAKLREKLGREYSTENIVQYSYNAQKHISFRVQRNEKIVINGTVVPLNRTFIDPKKKVRYSKGSARFFLIPASFPPSHMITLSDGVVKYEIFISRKPNDSLHEITFESNREDYLFLHMDYNSKTRKSKFNLSINLKESTKISNYVRVYAIYKAFFYGTIQINGVALGEMKLNKTKTKYSDEIYKFWQKVYEIESILALDLNPKDHHVTNKEFRAVEELYQTLIKKEPIKLTNKIESFSFGEDMDLNNVSTNLNKSLVFSYFQPCDYSLFDSSFTVMSLYCVFFCKLTAYEKIQGGYRVDVQDSSPDTPMFISKLSFANEEEIETFSVMTTPLYEKMRLAKTIDEYLA